MGYTVQYIFDIQQSISGIFCTVYSCLGYTGTEQYIWDIVRMINRTRSPPFDPLYQPFLYTPTTEGEHFNNQKV